MDSRAASRLRAQGIPLSLAALLALSCHAQILHAQACPPYERQSWGDGWADADGDCQNTRQEALIEESKEPVGFKGTGKCKVTTGSWDNPYTGEGHASPERLVVAPLVSLKEAHESGGHAWPAARKRLYANMLSDPDHLIVVSAATLQSMEGKDPAEWLPGNATDQAAHARIWARIKNTWDLTADQAERAALRRLLGATAILPPEMPETCCVAVGIGDPRALRNANGVECDYRACSSELQKDVNQLRRELWDTQSGFLSWWLQATSVFLALITLIVILIGSFSIYRFFRLEKEAREHADEIKRHASESKAIMEELQGASAQGVSDSPEKFQDIGKIVQSNPQATMLDKALAEAISTQQSAKSANEHKRAEEKWRTVAWLAQEWKNGEVAAQAWFSVGYLIQEKNPEYKRGDPDSAKEAISCYDKVLDIDPSNTDAYNNRGIAKAALGDRQAAIADYDKALEINPSYADAYANRGGAKAALGDRQAAIADYDEALEIDSNLAGAYTNRGNAKAALGDRQAAIADYDKALEINPSYADAYANRGGAKAALGDRQAAIADYDKALEINPSYADAYTLRGNAKAALGDRQAAIADHDRALEINPSYADAYTHRGNAKAALGDHQAAIADHDRALEINPNLAGAYTNRGISKAALGGHQAAIANHDRALEIDSNLAGAYSNRGGAKSALGDHQAAIADCDEALEIDSNLAGAYTNRGNAKAALGDHQAAIADHDRALEIDPNDATVYSNRGSAKAALGDHQAAIADYDKALEIDSNLAGAYSNRGDAKSALGDHQAAISDCDKALEIKPDYANAYNNRAVANAALGRKNAARSDFKTTLELARKAGRNDLATLAKEKLLDIGNDEDP